MERLKTFYTKYLRLYIVLLFLIAIAINFVIELLARHSLILTLQFLFGHPVVYFCNVFIIFAVISLAMFFRRRVFATCMLSMLWLLLGVINGVILLKDGRIVKILEVLPVLFDLKSDMEKENLIYYFASYLKIAPTHLQIRIVNRPADIRYYTKRMEDYEKDEPSETCRALIRDNIQEVDHLAQNEVLNIRIFLIFQLEPDMKLRGSTLEAAAERMYEEAQTARRYLDMCGLEVLEPQYEDNFQLELLYQLLNPNTSRSAPLPLHIFDAVSTFAGITEEEMCRRAQEAADEDVQEAIASSPPDEGA